MDKNLKGHDQNQKKEKGASSAKTQEKTVDAATESKADDKDVTPIPTDFKERVSKALEEKKTPAIIFNTGSYCPVHRNHVDFMLENKKFLEANFDIKVICCYLSPSHDDYVFSKMNDRKAAPYFIDFATRCKLIESLLKNLRAEKDVFVDRWEGLQEKSLGFYTVWKLMQGFFSDFVRKQGLKASISVFYCVGSDMLKSNIDEGHKKFQINNKLCSLPLLICDRPEANSYRAEKKMLEFRKMKKEEMKKENIFINKETSSTLTLSSSLLREILEETLEKKSKESLDPFLDKETQEILLDYLRNRRK